MNDNTFFSVVQKCVSVTPICSRHPMLLPLGPYGVEVSDFSCSSVCCLCVTLRIDPKRNPKIRQFRRNNGKMWTKNGPDFGPIQNRTRKSASSEGTMENLDQNRFRFWNISCQTRPVTWLRHSRCSWWVITELWVLYAIGSKATHALRMQSSKINK